MIHIAKYRLKTSWILGSFPSKIIPFVDLGKSGQQTYPATRYSPRVAFNNILHNWKKRDFTDSFGQRFWLSEILRKGNRKGLWAFAFSTTTAERMKLVFCLCLCLFCLGFLSLSLVFFLPLYYFFQKHQFLSRGNLVTIWKRNNWWSFY